MNGDSESYSKFSGITVSIQLISPASGNNFCAVGKLDIAVGSVSIQLISPASGNKNIPKMNSAIAPTRFHSINIPSEWE